MLTITKAEQQVQHLQHQNTRHYYAQEQRADEWGKKKKKKVMQIFINDFNILTARNEQLYAELIFSLQCRTHNLHPLL